ncbi:hypothetical protein [Bacillus marinisedimentorum]|uniref:hypothetical protein n=1 Tax=Bacillus marinisedimentorum TaxID=1821260 RepID=UPI0012FF6122|nr:hypothetical protein [Bacillus marinisedimentorum]
MGSRGPALGPMMIMLPGSFPVRPQSNKAVIKTLTYDGKDRDEFSTDDKGVLIQWKKGV